MRDYIGINPGAVPTDTEQLDRYLPELRRDLGVIDYFLRDLSRGIGRIQQGEVPDGSGNPIGDAKLSDLYWVLLGREEGFQVGYGGTGPGGYAVLASNPSNTKGFVYLGDNHGVAFDETNSRLGINETVPDAKLHITVAQPEQFVRPSSSGAGGVMWSAVGAATFHEATDDVGADTAGADYCRATGSLGGSAVLTIDLDMTTVTDPGVDTGFTIRVTMRSDNTNVNCICNISATQLGGIVVFDASPYNFGGPSYTGSADGGNVTGSFVQYEIPLSATEAARIDFTKLLSITFEPDLFSTGHWDVAQLELGFGSAPDTLQKWEYPSGSNLLDYAMDGNGATTLQFSGTPKFRVATSGMEIDIGTPTATKLLGSTDTEGTVGWQTVNLLSTYHPDTLAAAVARGAVIVGNSTPAWARVTVGAANTFLGSDGTDTTFRALSALTSAEFLDSAFRVIGSGDATKKLAFEVDGFTTATTRTLTPQNSSYTIAGLEVLNAFTRGMTIAPSTAEPGVQINISSSGHLTNAFVIHDLDGGGTDIFVVDQFGGISVGSIQISSGLGGTTSLVSLATITRTATFPNATGTVVFRAGTAFTTNEIMRATTANNVGGNINLTFDGETLNSASYNILSSDDEPLYWEDEVLTWAA